jgi:hypothetical protein
MANENLIDYLSGLLIPELYYNILGRRSYNLFFWNVSPFYSYRSRQESKYLKLGEETANCS